MSDACGRTRDRLPELALGVLGGDDRAEVLDHLSDCASCRAVAAEHAAVTDMLPLLLAEADPPAGFEARTLARLRHEQRGGPITPRRVTVGLAVAAAVVILLAVGAVVWPRGSGDEAAPDRVEAATMVGYGGAQAGTVFVVGGSERYVFVAADYGVRSGSYGVEVVEDGHARRVGSMQISEGRGSWAGSDAGGTGLPDAVRLVDAGGEPVCVARFEAGSV